MNNPLIEKFEEQGIKIFDRVTLDQLRKRLIQSIENNGMSDSTIKKATHRGLCKKESHVLSLDINGYTYSISVEINNEKETVTITYEADTIQTAIPVRIFIRNGALGFNWESQRTYFSRIDDYAVQANHRAAESVFASYMYGMLEKLATCSEIRANITNNKQDYSKFLKEIAEIRNNKAA